MTREAWHHLGVNTPGELAVVNAGAADQLLGELRRLRIAHVVRTHEPARHARHLAALWEARLDEVGRATLFYADGAAILCLVPADRKVSAPRLRDLLSAGDVRVLRGDRGVGRLGWSNMPGAPGALPAVPAMFAARGLVDERVVAHGRVAVALGEGRSVSLSPVDYVRVVGADVARFSGTTRLLPEGGMVDERPALPAAAAHQVRVYE